MILIAAVIVIYCFLTDWTQREIETCSKSLHDYLLNMFLLNNIISGEVRNFEIIYEKFNYKFRNIILGGNFDPPIDASEF